MPIALDPIYSTSMGGANTMTLRGGVLGLPRTAHSAQSSRRSSVAGSESRAGAGSGASPGGASPRGRALGSFSIVGGPGDRDIGGSGYPAVRVTRVDSSDAGLDLDDEEQQE